MVPLPRASEVIVAEGVEVRYHKGPGATRDTREQAPLADGHEGSLESTYPCLISKPPHPNKQEKESLISAKREREKKASQDPACASRPLVLSLFFFFVI